jgi:hydrogenase 3 maturation protease
MTSGISFHGKNTVIIGIGNEFRGDDGIGPYITGKINSGENLKTFSINGRFEDYIDAIVKINPELIVVIDAANFEGEPGEFRRFSIDNLKENDIISTHTMPVLFYLELLKDRLPAAEITIIGIKPQDISMGNKISGKVRDAGDKIALFFNRT